MRRRLTGLFYHRTTARAAAAILRRGFRDAAGMYLTTHVHRGGGISDSPLDENEGARGDVLLEIRIPSRLVKHYEGIEEGKGYREFLVPAALLNTRARVRRIDRRSVVGIV